MRIVPWVLAGLLVLSAGTLDAKIKRSQKAVHDFEKTHPRPENCVRCEVHHVIPLYCGGKDAPENMMWLSRAEHQAFHQAMTCRPHKEK